MRSLPKLCAFPLIWELFFDHVSASDPWGMTWSDTTYGYDGPWHAVKVKLGSEDQVIDMYPGGSWDTYVLLDTLCDNTTKISSYCYGDSAGLFNPDNSDTWNGNAISLSPDHAWSEIQWGYTDEVTLNAYAYRALDSIDVEGRVTSSSNMIAIEQGYFTYPGGDIYPLEVGVLAMGCPDANQSFSRNNGESPLNGTFISSYLYENNEIPSYSYGMHIGAPKFSIPGSLYLGGYDKNRLLGTVSTQPINSGKLPIDMVGISIGVASGGSIWRTSNITGLMSMSNTSLTSGITVGIDATNPYIYLPKSTCDAIASYLPVSYHKDLGLYTWDTSNKNYTDVITSPSYLSFNFAKDDTNTEEFTINVPFALLNLTLSPPLVEFDTPYLPLMPTDGDPILGRAFLQAAAFGVHWSQAYWYMAQAPGPNNNFVSNVVDIEPSTTSISSSGSSWEDTWTTYWTDLPESISSGNATNSTNASQSTATPSSSSGLSTGAKAGIGVGCACAGIVVIGAAIWFFIRRRKNAKPLDESAYNSPCQPLQAFPPVEIANSRRDIRHELDQRSNFVDAALTGYYMKRDSQQTSSAKDPHSSTSGSGVVTSETSTTHYSTNERFELG
ncbi:hypothetical protein N7488_008968 [Penicillium malachiteum]|nr:hypothetical protein N7488_008968 [Penicillium malachiteum]